MSSTMNKETNENKRKEREEHEEGEEPSAKRQRVEEKKEATNDSLLDEISHLDKDKAIYEETISSLQNLNQPNESLVQQVETWKTKVEQELKEKMTQYDEKHAPIIRLRICGYFYEEGKYQKAFDELEGEEFDKEAPDAQRLVSLLHDMRNLIYCIDWTPKLKSCINEVKSLLEKHKLLTKYEDEWCITEDNLSASDNLELRKYLEKMQNWDDQDFHGIDLPEQFFEHASQFVELLNLPLPKCLRRMMYEILLKPQEVKKYLESPTMDRGMDVVDWPTLHEQLPYTLLMEGLFNVALRFYLEQKQ